MKLKLHSAILIMLAFAAAAFAQGTVVATAALDDASAVRTATFEKVWSTVNEKYFDPEFGGVDWDEVRRRYEPLARTAATDEALHSILRKMLSELKVSHFGIFPKTPSATELVRSSGSVGIDLVFIDGKPLVERIEPESAAEKSGVKTGLELRTLNGRRVTEILDEFDVAQSGRRMTTAMRTVYRERLLEGLVNGQPGTEVTIETQDIAGRSQTFRLRRDAFKGSMSEPFGSFPPQPVRFESRRLDGNIGYFRFNMWIIPQMAKLRNAVREFADTEAIIIDLRGNPGGIGGMASGLAGLMVEKQFSLGTMRTRDTSTSFIAYPQPNPYSGRIVILTDHGSGSTSEVFASGMQEAGIATVIGERTAGAVLPSVFETLPTGAVFQYAISDYRSPNNILIEGRGVFPDISVSPTRASLVTGRDIQLERAIEFVKKGK